MRSPLVKDLARVDELVQALLADHDNPAVPDELIRELTKLRTRVRRQDHDLHAYERIRGIADTLVAAFADALNRDHLDLATTLDDAFDLARDIFYDFRRSELAIVYKPDLDALVKSARKHQVSPTRGFAAPDLKGSVAARRLTEWAASLLPPEVRARYEAEFSSELYELVAAGTSPWRQTVYALRLLTRAVPMRRATRPEPERAR